MNTEHDWTVWWNNEGSGMRPLNGQDNESHVRDMTRIAWLNGAFGAADEIERLRKECFHLSANQCHAGYGGEYGHHRCAEIDRLTRERDEARREVCLTWESVMGREAQTVAEDKGWDCFKENNDD